MESSLWTDRPHHYALKCRECGFTHEIPHYYNEEGIKWVVDEAEVEITCVYGERFTVVLEAKEFFELVSQPAERDTLLLSIGDNMGVLHEHLTSHRDPLYLAIRQAPDQTRHEYTAKAPEDAPYVGFSRTGGIDIVGDIDPSKAEIPGVS